MERCDMCKGKEKVAKRIIFGIEMEMCEQCYWEIMTGLSVEIWENENGEYSRHSFTQN